MGGLGFTGVYMLCSFKAVHKNLAALKSIYV